MQLQHETPLRYNKHIKRLKLIERRIMFLKINIIFIKTLTLFLHQHHLNTKKYQVLIIH